MNFNRAGNSASPFGFLNPPKTASKRVTLAPPPFQLLSSEAHPPIPKPAGKDSLRTGLEHLAYIDLSLLRKHIQDSRPDGPLSFGQVLHID